MRRSWGRNRLIKPEEVSLDLEVYSGHLTSIVEEVVLAEFECPAHSISYFV